MEPVSSQNVVRDEAREGNACCPGQKETLPFIRLSVRDESPADQFRELPPWADGTVMTAAGPVIRVSSSLSKQDVWGHVRCRISAFRNDYRVPPGIYAAGNPDGDSDVFASANYKYSFDLLRQALGGMNAWVLVLDTKGINVWCAAGKGTFGTEELIQRMALTKLHQVVRHRRIIIPQLAGPGIRAHTVAKQTGFRVLFGPVNAKDIPAYVRNGRKATREMRTVRFSMRDRLVLTPMEINPAMKMFPLFALVVLVLSGLNPSGILFRDAFREGMPLLLLGLAAVFSGAFVTPMLLPFIPFRSFAVKGWLVGAAVSLLILRSSGLFDAAGVLLRLLSMLFFPMAASYIALQFTGSTTFTGMSGVRKELRIALPLYITVLVISCILLLYIKLDTWGVR